MHLSAIFWDLSQNFCFELETIVQLHHFLLKKWIQVISFSFTFYPSATSKIIMIVKPSIKLNVAKSVLLLA